MASQVPSHLSLGEAANVNACPGKVVDGEVSIQMRQAWEAL